MVDLAEGGVIGAWDLLASRVPLASVLRRRPEAIHQQLTAAVAAGTAGPAGDQPVSPHDAVVVKEMGLERYLVYDRHERRSGLVHLLDPAQLRTWDRPSCRPSASTTRRIWARSPTRSRNWRGGGSCCGVMGTFVAAEAWARAR